MTDARPIVRVATESGSVYDFEHRTDGIYVRRVGIEAMRRDGDWVRLIRKDPIELNAPMRLILEPLGDGDVTARMTSRVTEIIREDQDD